MLQRRKKHNSIRLLIAISFWSTCLFSSFTQSSPDSQAKWDVQTAVAMAVQRDQVIQQLAKQALAASEKAISTNQLPDPTLNLSAKNLPTDTFDFDQETMTQLVVGISQMFPAGDSLKIRRDIQEQQGAIFSQQAELRKLSIIKMARQGWYEVFYWLKAVEILEKDKALFEKLLKITQSMYSVGRKQQHDIIRAELEIGRLQERLVLAKHNVKVYQEQLARWSGEDALFQHWPADFARENANTLLSYSRQELASILKNHPLLQAIDKTTNQKQLTVKLNEQSYQPQWGIDISYAYRDGENINGGNRADFASAMINVQLPLFQANRQDKSLSASRYELEAQRHHHIDALRHQIAEFYAERMRLIDIQARISLYQQQLLQQSSQQARSTLTAYEADTTDFAELMRAYLTDQQTQLAYQRLIIDEQKQVATLHFLAGTDHQKIGHQKGAYYE